MRPNRRVWVLLLVALAARLLLQGWDSGLLSPHPDERQVAFVSESMHSWLADPGFYAYGSLHFQAVRAATAALVLPRSYGGLLIGGRTLSLAASMASLLLAWWLARAAWGRRTADTVLAIGALVPLDLQLSHFATVEAHHAFWVMACLAACYAFSSERRLFTAALVGLTWGASLAVKVSSLPLILSVVIALVAVWRGAGWRRSLALAGAAAATAAATFALCQPSALAAAWPPLDPAYLTGVSEQVAMVTGRADLPYVRVYHDTPLIIYALRELTLWGLGPALLLAALYGLAVAVRRLASRLRGTRQWSRSTVLVALLVAWLLPMALRLATLDVKFLRYWQPLVVPLVMIAAWAMLRQPRRRRWPVRVVVAGTALWGLMYLWGFLAPHPHRTAEQWLSPLIAAGERVAFEHWDESLRLTEPEEAGPRITLPSYDLPDNQAKIRRWCTDLAEADWLVLTSHRIRRTLFANPERFPESGRLYRLLLAGETGFMPLSQAARGPRLFGLRTPVQLADESFVNYDFPRVVVFRRIAAVDVDRLVERVGRPEAALDDLGYAALERRFVDPLPQMPSTPRRFRQVADLLLWLLVFTALGASAWLILAPLLRGWADAGAGLALVTGWMAPAWLMWFGCELGLWPAGAVTASAIVVAVLGLGGVLGWRRRVVLRRLWRRRWAAIRLVLAAALAVMLLFLAVRLGNPAVYWGEKPMDFSFLNAFVSAEQWPPGEPWMAGESLNYYYFGEVLAAFPILVSGVGTAVGYNLAVSTIPALVTALLAGFGLTVARRRRREHGLVFPLLVVLTGNLAWPFLLDLARDRRWFDLWWATSRVIPGFAIEEYPLWTTVFADLHAHFVAFPVLIAALLWAWTAVVLRRRTWLLAALLCAISVAVLAATNPWDILLFTAALGIGVLAAAARPLVGLGRLLVAAAASLIAAAPFLVELATWLHGNGGGRSLFLTGGDFAPAWAIARHFGLFLIPLALLALSRLGRDFLIATPLAAVAVYAGLSFESSAAALALVLAVLFFTVLSRSKDHLQRLMWSLAGLAALTVAFCERFTMMDRMNTIFKLYNGAWLLLAVALGLALLLESGWRRKLVVFAWLPLQLVAMVNLPLGIAQGWLQPRTPSPRPTLDGQAFLAQRDPQTWRLSTALTGMARPSDVVAEAAGDPYRNFTRIAMHTGLATVVGWEHHLFQRGQSRDEIRARFNDLDTLYSGRDPGQRRRILDSYRVSWIVLADEERRAYRGSNEVGLAEIPGVVRIAGRDGAELYRVLGID